VAKAINGSARGKSLVGTSARGFVGAAGKSRQVKSPRKFSANDAARFGFRLACRIAEVIADLFGQGPLAKGRQAAERGAGVVAISPVHGRSNATMVRNLVGSSPGF